MKGIDFKNIYEWPLIRRSLVIGLVCVVVFYFGYRWDLSSLGTSLTSNRQQESDLKNQLETVISKEATIRDYTSQYSDFQLLLNQWQKKMIRYNELPGLLNDILKMGANYQLYFSLVDPGEDTKEGDYYKVPIKIVAVGSYHQLSEFISQVANLPQILVISDFTISRENKNDELGAKLAAEATEKNLLTAELFLEVYHLPENQAHG